MPLLMRLHTLDTFRVWLVGAVILLLSLGIPVPYSWLGLAVMRRFAG